MLAFLVQQVGSQESAVLCLVSKVLVDVHGEGLLTQADVDVLAASSAGRINLPEVEALLMVADGGVALEDTNELLKLATLLMHMLRGTLCARKLMHLLQETDVSERDQRIAALLQGA